ncbi:MAG: NUDIX hydrolase [Burkholderia sp.]|nr:NUDIX hydrolase [Burkholderia sp.]
MSCGVVMLDVIGRVFLAHATKTPHWDIPKGHRNYGEMPRDASLRELTEETGIVLESERLVDLGCFKYRSDKSLHLFGVRIALNEIDIARCICTSMFLSSCTGRMTPEMDSFRWSEPDEAKTLVNYSLERLFTTRLQLVDLHHRL